MVRQEEKQPQQKDLNTPKQAAASVERHYTRPNLETTIERFYKKVKELGTSLQSEKGYLRA